MKRPRNPVCRFSRRALCGVLSALLFVADGVSAHAPAPYEIPGVSEADAGLIEDLFGDDERLAHAAYHHLLQDTLPHPTLVAIVERARGQAQFALAQAIARHQVLTRLRKEELDALEDDAVIVGFQFTVMATAGQLGPGTAALVEQYPWGAQVSTTTPGFPGFAYLRPGDMIVRVGEETLPADRLVGQRLLVETVKSFTLDQEVPMTVIRRGEAIDLSIPLVRAAALAEMYDPRTLTRDLIDPFLFLWEEAWIEILLDAGYDEAGPEFNDEGPGC